jgi:hypothetical protein
MKSETSFLMKRALEEDEAARRATCPQARRCHEELAIAYRRRAGQRAGNDERD